ncbi:MAG: cysteine peptidase family C39 domain-containing protein [Rubripirellula sp.]|nr:cysteine peptidase family C39 domain-containing protein [Rubripirellula sp.]
METGFRRRFVSFAVIALLGFCGAASAQVSLSQRSVVRDPSFRIAKPVKSWREIKTEGIVMQQRDYSCGAAALATLLRFYWGHRINEAMVLDVIEQQLSPEELKERESSGLSMADIKEAAVELGYQATVGKVSFEDLTGSKVPVVVVINLGGQNHFVVFRGVAAGCVFLADPLRGNLRITESSFQNSWQENAVLVAAPKGETQSERSQLAIKPAELYRGSLNRQVIRRATSAGF